MTPEEITTDELQESAFADLLAKALPAPRVEPLPPGLSERIAAATYARPSFWGALSLALRPAPVRLALGGAVSAGVLCAVFLPRLPKAPSVMPPAAHPTAPRDRAETHKVSPPAPERALLATPAPNKIVAIAPPAVRETGGSQPEPVAVTKPEKPAKAVTSTVPTTSTKVAVIPFRERIRIAPELAAPRKTHATTSGVLAGHTAPEVSGISVAAVRTKAEPEANLTSVPVVTQPTPAPAASRAPRVEVALAGGEEEKPFKVSLNVTNEQMKQESKIASLRSEGAGQVVATRTGSKLSFLGAPVE